MVAPLLRILVLGEFGQRKCREEGERKKRMGPRGHLKTTLKRGEGEFGGKGREANHTLEVLRSLPPFSDGCSF